MKKRKKPSRKGSKQNNMGKYVVTHSDEQLEGALMECLQKLKNYSIEGAIILRSDDEKWKVLAFGYTKTRNFEAVLGDSLIAGVEALKQGVTILPPGTLD